MTGRQDIQDIEDRARTAAAALRQATSWHPPELADLVRVGQVRRWGRVLLAITGLVVLTGVCLAFGSVADPATVRWITGGLLLLLLASTWLLCAHAGGHALFVPLPALALAVIWAVLVEGRHTGTGWWLVALTAAAAGLGGLLGTTALRQQVRAGTRPPPTLIGAVGRAVTDLAPAGVVQVQSETWSAVSVSGPLTAGSQVHVAAVDGVRLRVWSEAGEVPDERSLRAAAAPDDRHGAAVDPVEPEEEQP
jgi:membrane protein implicated in regulation of membrane protease activity